MKFHFYKTRFSIVSNLKVSRQGFGDLKDSFVTISILQGDKGYLLRQTTQ